MVVERGLVNLISLFFSNNRDLLSGLYFKRFVNLVVSNVYCLLLSRVVSDFNCFWLMSGEEVCRLLSVLGVVLVFVIGEKLVGECLLLKGLVFLFIWVLFINCVWVFSCLLLFKWCL